MRQHPLISFFLITFLVTWGIAGLFFLFPEQVVAITRKEADAYHPLFRIAASAPTLSAFLVILYLRGKEGLITFISRYLDLAIRLRWYLVIFGGMTGFGLALRYIEQTRGMDVPGLSFSLYSFIPFAIYYLFADPGPLGEEGGWRGFALPLLQRHISPFWASIILGAVWSIWHLPAFYISTLNQSSFPFLFFLFNDIALTMFMTYVYNASRGSIPLMIVIHWAFNLTGFFVSMNRDFFLVCGILFLMVALLLSWLHPVTPGVEPIPG